MQQDGLYMDSLDDGFDLFLHGTFSMIFVPGIVFPSSVQRSVPYASLVLFDFLAMLRREIPADQVVLREIETKGVTESW